MKTKKTKKAVSLETLRAEFIARQEKTWARIVRAHARRAQRALRDLDYELVRAQREADQWSTELANVERAESVARAGTEARRLYVG